MDNRTPANDQAAMDALLAQTTDQANLAADGADAVLETGGDSPGGAIGEQGVDRDYCQEVIASACAWHADAVRDEFYSALAPVVGQGQAERVANRAAMSPAIQRAIAEHGAAVAEKYGVARFINSEAAVIGALICYARDLSKARKERDELIAATMPKQPKATP